MRYTKIQLVSSLYAVRVFFFFFFNISCWCTLILTILTNLTQLMQMVTTIILYVHVILLRIFIIFKWVIVVYRRLRYSSLSLSFTHTHTHITDIELLCVINEWYYEISLSFQTSKYKMCTVWLQLLSSGILFVRIPYKPIPSRRCICIYGMHCARNYYNTYTYNTIRTNR